MKNILLLSLLLLQLSAFSQDKMDILPSPKRFSMELMGGFSQHYMPINFPDVEVNTGGRSGFYAGLAGRFTVTPQWAIRLEAQYSAKGFEQDGFKSRIRFQLDYVDILPQAEYQIIPNLSVSLGGFAAFRGGARVNYGDSGWEKPNEEFFLISKKDFGLATGFTGYFGRFRAYARYQHGLYDLERAQFTDELGNMLKVSRYSRNIQIGLGYRLL